MMSRGLFTVTAASDIVLEWVTVINRRLGVSLPSPFASPFSSLFRILVTSVAAYRIFF